MADTVYTRVYTYKGQSNTSSRRTVAWSRFSVSGDTAHTMGTIVAMRYKHHHTSTGSAQRTLYGEIKFLDGTSIRSGGYTQQFSGDIKLFTNTFSQLPSAAQLLSVSSIDTVDSAGSNHWSTDSWGTGKILYWRATNEYPMKLEVDFIERAPAYYAPKIEAFTVGRCNENGEMDDGGQYIATTARLSIGDSAGLGETCSVRVHYSNSGAATESDPYIDLTSRMSELMTAQGLQYNTALIPGKWTDAYAFMLSFHVGNEAAEPFSDSVGRLFAPIFVSFSGKRVSIGGFPRGESEESLDVHFPTRFYAGEYQKIALPADSEFKDYETGDAADGHGIFVRNNGFMVEMFGMITPKATIAGSTTQHSICTLPQDCRPKYQINQLCQGTNQAVWMLRVDTNGVVGFARYRSGASFTDAAAGNWLPFHVMWLAQ